MSRAAFISKLKEALSGLPQSEVEEITSDYEFHFAEAVAAGQSEDDIAARLGDPTRLARELREDAEQRRSGVTATKAIGAELTGPRRPDGIRLILAVLVACSAAIGIYYVARPHDVGIKPADLASRTINAPENHNAADVVGAEATSLPASRILISGEQTLDLGPIDQEKLYVVVDGGAKVTAHGHVKSLILHIDGSGQANFEALRADGAQVDLSGTGDAEVTASQVADVTISGSGMVRLKAKPKLLRQTVTGSGRVILPANNSRN